MKRYFNRLVICAGMLAAVTLGGCYSDFNTPEAFEPATDQDIINDGCELVTINKLKDLFYAAYPNGGLGRSLEVDNNYAIKGKVISYDRYGNIYRSLYLQDASGGDNGAIEIKIGTTGLYNDYKPGQTVYVKAKGLILGNYRFMLSLGGKSADASYANGYIDIRPAIDHHVIKGSMTSLTAQDTLVIENYGELRDPQDLGRLVRIKNLKSKFGTAEGDDKGYSSTDVFPSFLEQKVVNKETQYNNYEYLKVIEEWKAYEAGETLIRPVSPRPGIDPTKVQDKPSWAFKNQTDSYYGSALFYGKSEESVEGEEEERTETKYYNYIVRSSGYSRFALNPLPEDGKEVDITAIYTKYSSSSGGFIKYQLLLNNVSDVVVK